MTQVERSGDVAATINHLAAGSFKNHVLTWEADKLSWLCRAPGSGNHAFRVYFAPGTVFVWGDIGEYVFIHSDRDSIGWWLCQGGKEGDYPDYFLSKLRAVGSEKGAKEFYIGDAYDWITERITELNTELAADLAECGDDEDEQDERDSLQATAASAVQRWVDLRIAFDEQLGNEDDDPRCVWGRVYVDATGDAEVPECEGPTSSALWVWHAARAFARLHAAREAEAAQPTVAP